MDKLSKFELLQIAATMLSNDPSFTKLSDKSKVRKILEFSSMLEKSVNDGIEPEKDVSILDVL